MAKSIRSKRRLKMRNVKREHYAKKDLERLKKCVEIDRKNLGEIATVKSAEEVKMQIQSSAADSNTEMDVDKAPKKYDKKTRQDEHGHYPVWMNQRQIKKHKKKYLKKQGKKVGKSKVKW